jgi:hypothetical protein
MKFKIAVGESQRAHRRARCRQIKRDNRESSKDFRQRFHNPPHCINARRILGISVAASSKNTANQISVGNGWEFSINGGAETVSPEDTFQRHRKPAARYGFSANFSAGNCKPNLHQSMK